MARQDQKQKQIESTTHRHRFFDLCDGLGNVASHAADVADNATATATLITTTNTITTTTTTTTATRYCDNCY